MPLFDILTRSSQKENKIQNELSFPDPMYSLSVKREKIIVGTYMKQSNDNCVYYEGRKFFHRLPPSKIGWSHRLDDTTLFASTTTSLRVWKTTEEKPLLKLQTSSKAASSTPGVPSPLTSFDWNPVQNHKIATSALDTTISIWDTEKGKMDTQLIAHDKGVFDVAYGDAYQFASVSEDGSLRLFDSRDLDHSTIIYEGPSPMLRVYWNTTRAPNFLATIGLESKEINYFDLRKSGFIAGTLQCPSFPNALSWSGNLLAAGLSDGSSIVFDLLSGTTQMLDLRHNEPVSNISWINEGSSLAMVHGNRVSIRSLN